MRFPCAPLALALLLTSGCGYVHFGRLPDAPLHDATLNTAYSNLSTDYKILKQELALVRKEGDALRAVIDNSGGGKSTADLVTRLNETTRELAALRLSYAKLTEAKASAAPASRTPSAPDPAAKELEDKLAVSLRNYTQLQEENARLRSEVARTTAENATLTTQVKSVTAQNEQAQAALAQLNTELLAQKEARGRAEQQASATAAQLSAVMAGANTKPVTLADARETSARASTALSAPVEGSATAELRTNPIRVAPPAPTPASAAPPADAPRIHIVVANDTLEKIAQKYYGDPSRWRTIYFANNAVLSGGRPLEPGMKLEIPKE